MKKSNHTNEDKKTVFSPHSENSNSGVSTSNLISSKKEEREKMLREKYPNYMGEFNITEEEEKDIYFKKLPVLTLRSAQD